MSSAERWSAPQERGAVQAAVKQSEARKAEQRKAEASWDVSRSLHFVFCGPHDFGLWQTTETRTLIGGRQLVGKKVLVVGVAHTTFQVKAQSFSKRFKLRPNRSLNVLRYGPVESKRFKLRPNRSLDVSS